MSKGEVEAAFEWALRAAGVPAWERNHKPFPDDKREIDFAWPGESRKVGVEIQEETSHRYWRKQEQDARKLNELQLMDWTLLHFTGTMVTADPWGCIDTLRQALGRSG